MEATVEFWHVVDGKWRQLTQCEENNVREYYTDGILEAKQDMDEDGAIIINQVNIEENI